MKFPEKPPPFRSLIQKIAESSKLEKIIDLEEPPAVAERYLHWDRFRYLPMPEGFTAEECWAAVKLRRSSSMKELPLKDTGGRNFRFNVPDKVQLALHEIDIGAGGSVGIPEPITNPQTKDRYLIRSLMEEAITSSQLEGAVTTREVAKELIRTGREPRDTSERMILNNFLTMKKITGLGDAPLSRQLVFDIHRSVTANTLDDETAAGRFRRKDEKCVVGDDVGNVFHQPPNAVELESRMDAMCTFANNGSPDFFLHPVLRAIVLHFWLAYDHPFIDGNGRTARALFYWFMQRSGYWLFEFISISNILRRAPTSYVRSFLHTETDDNDLTYFLFAQMRVIRRAIDSLHSYIDRKTREIRGLEIRLRALEDLNHRQIVLVRHALTHPYQTYTIESHKNSHNVAYQTARTDLMSLADHEILDRTKRGRRSSLPFQPISQNA